MANTVRDSRMTVPQLPPDEPLLFVLLSLFVVVLGAAVSIAAYCKAFRGRGKTDQLALVRSEA